jgi:DNA primase
MFLDKFVEKSHINLLQPTSKIPLAYLVSRGLSLDEIKANKIGFTPMFYDNVNPDEHDDAAGFNKWLGTRGKFIKQRLLFPIYDELGSIRGIETRALDRRAMDVLTPNFKIKLKDLIANLPESEVRYKKFYLEKNKYMALFFGLPEALDEIWKTDTVFLTEGIFDLISFKKIRPNCLSPLTANINEYQIKWLKRYVKKVVLLFDPDKKGKQAVEKLTEELEPDIRVQSINLKGMDVNDFLMKYGVTEFKYYVEDKLETFF